MPYGSVLGIESIVVNKKDKVSLLWCLLFSGGENNKQTKRNVQNIK